MADSPDHHASCSLGPRGASLVDVRGPCLHSLLEDVLDIENRHGVGGVGAIALPCGGRRSHLAINIPNANTTVASRPCGG